VLGSIREIQRDNIGTFMSAFRSYGDIVRFRGPLKIDLVVHPEYVKHVLHEQHKNYPRPSVVQEKLSTIVGNGLVAAEGKQWRRSRRLAQPAFHHDRLERCVQTITATTADMLDSWDASYARGRPIDVKSQMMHLSLQNLARSLFASDLGAEVDRIEPAVAHALQFTHRRMTSPIDPYRIPSRSSRAFAASLETINSVLYPMISARRRRDGEGDLVRLLLDALDEETGASYTDRQIRDEVSGFFVAGHETVSSALTWTCYLLSLNAVSWRRVRAEVDTVLGGRVPTVTDIPALQYTTMAVQEAMRLFPPIFVYMRCAAQDDVIGGYGIPAGRWVVVCPYVTHRHPEYWENAEAFDPERFLPERSSGRPRTAYLPFGAGPRKCIGDSFAMLQMPLVMAMIVQRFRLDLVGGLKVVPEPAISLRPRDPVLMRLTRVQDEAVAS